MSTRVESLHLERRACVYVRQAAVTPDPDETRRSMAPQYAMAERARTLGFAREAIEVIDEDAGRGGNTLDGRSGILRLVEAVQRSEVGAVLATNISRLTRSSRDLRRLLSLLAEARTLFIDEQRVCNPREVMATWSEEPHGSTG